MTRDELAVMPNGKCIVQVRALRPFYSDKFDIKRHPRYLMLAEAGVSVETVYVPAPNMEEGLIASVKGATIGFFKRYFARGMPLPDLIYFTDDHAAEAGLLYLAVAGVEVPDDVRVVAWSNKGLAPVYVKDVTRLEMDPYANGERLSDYVLALLRGDDAPVRPELAAAFVDGETFPQNLGSTKAKQKSKRG